MNSQMASHEDDYRLLEVSASASPSDIKAAYLVLVNVWHPDRFAHDPKLQRTAQNKLKAINDAYRRIAQAPLAAGPSRPPAIPPQPARPSPTASYASARQPAPATSPGPTGSERQDGIFMRIFVNLFGGGMLLVGLGWALFFVGALLFIMMKTCVGVLK